MAKFTETAVLTVDGKNYTDWESVSVQHILRGRPPYLCRFTCSEGVPLVQSFTKMQIMPGAFCTVTLAGKLAFTGKVTTRQVFVDARRHHIEIQCANNLALETSSVVSKTMEYKNNTPEQIIRSVLKPFGINLVVENGKLPNIKIPRYSATHGESVHDFIDTLTRHLGVDSQIGISHTSNVKGDFCVLVGPGKAQDALVEGQNMLEGREIIYDPNMAGGVPSPAQGPGTDDKHGAQVASEPFFSKAFDTLGKKYVPGVLVPEMPFFGKELHEGRATSESNWLLEDYVTVYGTVQGWLRPSGGLWERGQQVTVRSPMLVMNGTPLTVKSATFTQDNTTGTRTVLELCNAKALQGGIPTPNE
jgi:prophage tail gpP-like protein